MHPETTKLNYKKLITADPCSFNNLLDMNLIYKKNDGKRNLKKGLTCCCLEKYF